MFRPKVQGHLGRAPPGWRAHPTPGPSCLHRVAAGQPPVGVEQDLGHRCPPPPALHVAACLRLGLPFRFCFLAGDRGTPPARTPHSAHLCFPRLGGEAPRGHVGSQCWLRVGRQAAQVRGGGVGALLVLSGASGVGVGGRLLLPARQAGVWIPGQDTAEEGLGLACLRSQSKGCRVPAGAPGFCDESDLSRWGGAPSHRECLLHP